jgi:phosphoribosylformylglycinamidine cyclo-ligase
MDYKKAGVDIEAGYRAVELMKKHVQTTMRPEVLGGLGGFSGAFSLTSFRDMEKPTLVSGTDGVGTKLKLAFMMDKHDSVGIDCVAMCVNDIACAGGEPLFFLDYIACGKNRPEKIADIVKGVAEGCRQAGAALIGGETAEMPGFYPEDEYDLAGFAVGIVDEKDIITGKYIKEGDQLIGIASSGVHSNGFSLIRKVFNLSDSSLHTYREELGSTLGETLLVPTKIYVDALRSVKKAGVIIKGCSHITGGGFYENIPRMLPSGIRAVIRRDSYMVPQIFDLIRSAGDISEEMMYNTYNMGIGMCLAVSPGDVHLTMDAIEQAGEVPYLIGYCEKSDGAASVQLK